MPIAVFRKFSPRFKDVNSDQFYHASFVEVIRGNIALSSCMGLSRYLPSPPTQMAALLPRTCFDAFPVGQLSHPFLISISSYQPTALSCLLVYFSVS